jgi:hypothetical protein
MHTVERQQRRLPWQDAAAAQSLASSQALSIHLTPYMGCQCTAHAACSGSHWVCMTNTRPPPPARPCVFKSTHWQPQPRPDLQNCNCNQHPSTNDSLCNPIRPKDIGPVPLCCLNSVHPCLPVTPEPPATPQPKPPALPTHLQAHCG